MTWFAEDAPRTDSAALELDRRYPGRARRRVGSLAEYVSHTRIGSKRWRTLARDGERGEWVEVTAERDPWVVRVAEGEEL